MRPLVEAAYLKVAFIGYFREKYNENSCIGWADGQN